MFIRHWVAATVVAMASHSAWAETTPAQATPTRAAPAAQPATAQPATPPPLTNAAATPLAPNTLAGLQQKHKLELEQQHKRLGLLEQANQEALAKNQELQIKNDNLAVQIQVLQSERSAQMFLYGAVTFGAGTVTGLIIYSLLYTRRRRPW